jgi:hypothetical protein
MKRKEFVIRPKHIIIGLLVFVALAVLGFAIVPQAINNITTPTPAEVAAREGAQAFLSTDVEKGQAAWETSVCKVASQEGCQLVQKSIAPMLWPSVERGKVRQECQATKATLTADTPADGDKLHSQVWKVTLECQDLASGKGNTGDIDVLISEHGQDWQFDHVLFTQESTNAEK